MPGVVHRIVSSPPDLTGVPAELLPAIEACLAKEPERRPSPAEVARLLAAPPRRVPPSGRVGRRAVLAGGAAAVLGVPVLLWRWPGGAADEGATPLTTPRPVVLAGGPSATFQLAFTSDSATLVCAGSEQIWRWPVASGRGTAHELGADGSHQLTELSGDGRLVATQRSQEAIRLWDAATGTRLRTITLQGASYNKALSADGRTLATEGSGGIELWDTATGRRTGAFAPRGDPLLLTFDATGDRIAAITSGGGGVQIRDLRANRDIADVVVDKVNVLFTFAPDGRTAATDVWDKARPERKPWTVLAVPDAAPGVGRARGHRAGPGVQPRQPRPRQRGRGRDDPAVEHAHR